MLFRSAQIDSHIASTTNPHSTSIVNLTDTDVSSPVEGHVLMVNSSGDWENKTLSAAGIASASHTHDAADVVSGSFVDARISQSSVTQHESAINHQNILGKGTNSHAQIDSHIASTTNPHSTSIVNLTDTDVSSPVEGHVLMVNSSGDWENKTLSAAGIASI